MQTPDEPILDYLQRRLKDAGSARWKAIAREVGCPEWLPRKVCYYKPDPETDKPGGPGVLTIQPLVSFFQAVDRGEIQLPDPLPADKKVAA